MKHLLRNFYLITAIVFILLMTGLAINDWLAKEEYTWELPFSMFFILTFLLVLGFKGGRTYHTTDKYSKGGQILDKSLLDDPHHFTIGLSIGSYSTSAYSVVQVNKNGTTKTILERSGLSEIQLREEVKTLSRAFNAKIIE